MKAGYAGVINMENIEIIPVTEKSTLSNFKKYLIKIYFEAYSSFPQYAYTHPREVKGYLQWLFNHSQGGFFVALEDTMPIGFISTDPSWEDHWLGEKVGEIHEIVVSPSSQKKGIGTLLLKKGIEFLQEKGHHTIGLWVGIENFKAQDFYKKHGFTPGPQAGKWLRMYLKLK